MIAAFLRLFSVFASLNCHANRRRRYLSTFELNTFVIPDVLKRLFCGQIICFTLVPMQVGQNRRVSDSNWHG